MSHRRDVRLAGACALLLCILATGERLGMLRGATGSGRCLNGKSRLPSGGPVHSRWPIGVILYLSNTLNLLRRRGGEAIDQAAGGIAAGGGAVCAAFSGREDSTHKVAGQQRCTVHPAAHLHHSKGSTGAADQV